ncbi:hypothetical protein [Bosea lathyri]|uniref:hypothetical protein n=1 Tax=Bosea lathyri TaxID=1036778 RepID=UPI0011AFF487|nr:hypothetical protein [Bosea lathyri]
MAITTASKRFSVIAPSGFIEFGLVNHPNFVAASPIQTTSGSFLTTEARHEHSRAQAVLLSLGHAWQVRAEMTASVAIGRANQLGEADAGRDQGAAGCDLPNPNLAICQRKM